MPQDSSSTSLRELEASAEAGNSEAQVALSEYFYNKFYSYSSQGTYDDALKFVHWLEKAAHQGNAKAQYNLGECYHNGLFVRRDDDKAIRLFEKAAEQNESRAEFALGSCYEYGKGVNENLTEAANWYKKAAAHGNIFGKAALEILCEKHKHLSSFQKQVNHSDFEKSGGCENVSHVEQLPQDIRREDVTANTEEYIKPLNVEPTTSNEQFTTIIPRNQGVPENKKFTPLRCAIAGICACVVCSNGTLLEGIGFLLALPLLGLPWLIFDIHDKSRDGVGLNAGEAIMVLLAGVFVSLLCAIPFMLIFGIYCALFR